MTRLKALGACCRRTAKPSMQLIPGNAPRARLPKAFPFGFTQKKSRQRTRLSWDSPKTSTATFSSPLSVKPGTKNFPAGKCRTARLVPTGVTTCESICRPLSPVTTRTRSVLTVPFPDSQDAGVTARHPAQLACKKRVVVEAQKKTYRIMMNIQPLVISQFGVGCPAEKIMYKLRLRTVARSVSHIGSCSKRAVRAHRPQTDRRCRWKTAPHSLNESGQLAGARGLHVAVRRRAAISHGDPRISVGASWAGSLRHILAKVPATTTSHMRTSRSCIAPDLTPFAFLCITTFSRRMTPKGSSCWIGCIVWSRAENLYVILDLHCRTRRTDWHEHRRQHRVSLAVVRGPQEQEHLLAIWRRLAAHYRDETGHARLRPC